VIRLALLVLRPFEIWHAARVKRAYRKGKYKQNQGKPAVTTRKV